MQLLAKCLFMVLLLLLNALQYSSCERFNIVPSPDSPCPGEFTGEPCLTLEQYVTNPSLSSNITFELHLKIIALILNCQCQVLTHLQ